MNNRIISLVIPVHNEQDNLLWHHDKITNFLDSTEQPFEIIYVDDYLRKLFNITSVKIDNYELIDLIDTLFI